MNLGLTPGIYFCRDSKGLEVDLLTERDARLNPIEIKSGQTNASDYFDSLKKWIGLSESKDRPAWLIYGGDKELLHKSVNIVPWRQLPPLTDKI